jgi:hypothetical protein
MPTLIFKKANVLQGFMDMDGLKEMLIFYWGLYAFGGKST